eukprot:m.37680 g.37680  ORF g.37680 m.37680 type:complete len:740 (+) comp9339_c0_seq1:250-2469(+)
MAANKVRQKFSPQEVEAKMLTMMRPGELFAFDEEQRIAIFEMVKDGSITIEEAHAEVKRTNPKSFEVKYVGSAPSPARTLKASLTDELGKKATEEAMARIKKTKAPMIKAKLHMSTIGVKIVQQTDDAEVVTLENEPILQVAYACVLSDKKRVAYVTSYSRLGLVWTHVVQCNKAAEAALLVEGLISRKTQAIEQKSLVPATNIEQMSSGVEDDDDDDETCAPLGVFHVQYLGNVAVSEIEGDEVVASAVDKVKDHISTKKSKRGLTADEDMEGIFNQPTVLVISSEGIRTVEVSTHELLYNVIIKAVSYSTEIVGKKVELFAFIEVDDRRNTRTCHVYMCEKGSKGLALKICDALCEAFQVAVKEAKARAGNPLLPMGRVREKVDGVLSSVQVARKGLTAIKAIGAGQFGKVYLATTEDKSEQQAVKMLRAGATSADRQEFLREAETMYHLGEHPNLVKFVGVAVQQRPWLVVLEFCQYGDLSDVLKALARRKVTLSVKEQLTMADQLAEGMGYIAEKRYVHMDLAARNVLLAEGGRLKVADFGLTHKFDDGLEHYKQLGVLKLSIRWLAIDSFDHKLFSEKSDIWSWGVTMWEVFSYGLQPYKGNKLPEVLKLVRSGVRLEKPKNCPEDFFKVMQTCWNINRHDRPTFKELSHVVKKMLAVTTGDVRDIGQLLNADLSDKLRQVSIRVKSKAQLKDKKDNTGLTGAVDMSTQESAPRPKSMQVSPEMAAALEAAEFN